MIIFCYGVAIFVSLSRPTHGSWASKEMCVPGQYKADDTDCTTFFQCTLGGFWTPKGCPPDLQFMNTPGACGYPSQDNCVSCGEGVCRNGASCANRLCVCSPGYFGPTCSEDSPSPSDPCASEPCVHGGLCHPTVEGGYTCDCPHLYTGPHCHTRVQCGFNHAPCQNQGSCITFPGFGFLCACPEGFTGEACETPLQDEGCLSPSQPCENGGSCVQESAGPQCHCLTGFSGTACQTAERCRVHGAPCQNAGTCLKLPVVGHMCLCAWGWRGQYCSVHVNLDDLMNLHDPVTRHDLTTVADPVTPGPPANCPRCENGGSCVDDVTGGPPYCLCPSAYVGSRCETACLPCPRFNPNMAALPDLYYSYKDWQDSAKEYRCYGNGTLARVTLQTRDSQNHVIHRSTT